MGASVSEQVVCVCVVCVFVLFVDPGDAEVAGTVRHCLAIQAKSGNSCWCLFYHIRGSESLGTCWTCIQA
jgi:hypothetical protein